MLTMLDVPITYRGKTIGVICIESLTSREWVQHEVNFAQLLSSLYSFSHSISQTNLVNKELSEFEDFVDNSVLVSKADSKGRITYVNDKFCEVSGWDRDEVIGKTALRNYCEDDLISL
jgi:PAS domain-containing protein